MPIRCLVMVPRLKEPWGCQAPTPIAAVTAMAGKEAEVTLSQAGTASSRAELTLLFPSRDSTL
jgi:hypothetical protein